MKLKKPKYFLRKINESRKKIFLALILGYPIVLAFFYWSKKDIILDYTSQIIFIGIILLLIVEVINETIKSIK